MQVPGGERRAGAMAGGLGARRWAGLYLAAELPLLIVRGARDRIIPPEHGRRAHGLVPGARFELFEPSGHFPHPDEPERSVRTLEDWIATTEPSTDRRRAVPGRG